MASALEIGALVVGVGASTYEGVSSYEAQTQAAQLQEEQIKTSEDSARASAAEDQIQRDQQLEAVQSQQKAAAAANGMALSSGTFSALQENAYNNFAQDTTIANTNLQMMEDQSEMAIDSTKAQLSQQHTSDWVSGISSAASAIGSMASVFTKAPAAAADAASGADSAKGMVSGWGGFDDSNPDSFSSFASSGTGESMGYQPYESYTGYK